MPTPDEKIFKVLVKNISNRYKIANLQFFAYVEGILELTKNNAGDEI